ncbi:hypothetical protein ABT294_13570 [Nonomuraea sp. NPDC000554]|uniref:hypothetical protein n=1 Tax=Nonomuraea sp. NPDC000554 TaxID=3154259 RepID=UPI0033267F2F
MKMALVSGDGLPVSGLLTIFRNVVDLGRREGLIELPVPADLGYSWRPDKPAFYPSGGEGQIYPEWLSVVDAVPAGDPEWFAAEITEIRNLVATAEKLSDEERAALRDRIEAVSGPYEDHFSRWFDEHDVDWVCAVNMTLSDAVPVTLALHRAAARRWSGERPGGLLFWDHDLFASSSVYEGDLRVYPLAPNEFTPVPGAYAGQRWAVVAEGLAKDAATYPTTLVPDLVPNILPEVPAGLAERHHEFLAQQGLEPGRPIVLCPVRVFRVKGVEIAVSLLAELSRVTEQRGEPAPYLLVFGSLGEDPEYTGDVLGTAAREGVSNAVRFLDGVPLSSYPDSSGQWHLDEIDLLRVCAASGGGVFFTPNRPDVETVGLGPALAAVAGVPCATTAYRVFDEVYGDDFGQVQVTVDDLNGAAQEFAGQLAALGRRDPMLLDLLAANHRRVLHRFSPAPWRELLRLMTQETR